MQHENEGPTRHGGHDQRVLVFRDPFLEIAQSALEPLTEFRGYSSASSSRDEPDAVSRTRGFIVDHGVENLTELVEKDDGSGSPPSTWVFVGDRCRDLGIVRVPAFPGVLT